MLGDAEGNGAGGFAVLDARTFELKGRWEAGEETPSFNYDYWYQPRKNALVSSEFGAPKAYEPGFDLDDVAAGRYGNRLHFWNLAERRLEQTLDLGGNGLLPLEARWLHDPEADEGFVGAALSSTMWHFRRDTGGWTADQVIAVDSVDVDGWPFPVPGLITDLVLSMDDRFLYFSDWLHGDLRQYDVSDPANPRLTGRLWLGGVLGKQSDAGRELGGGPQMLQLSYDGRRLYVTNSLYSTWTTSSTRSCARGSCASTATRTAAWRSTATSSSTSTTGPGGRRARTRCASRTVTVRRRSSSDPRALHGDPGRGDRPAARAVRRRDAGRDRRLRQSGARPTAPPAPSALRIDH